MLFFFFNDTATTEIYTLSLHDALPICRRRGRREPLDDAVPGRHTRDSRRGARDTGDHGPRRSLDRKSTRLNSSHANISYAVFCLKKKKIKLSHTSSSHHFCSIIRSIIL